MLNCWTVPPSSPNGVYKTPVLLFIEYFIKRNTIFVAFFHVASAMSRGLANFKSVGFSRARGGRGLQITQYWSDPKPSLSWLQLNLASRSKTRKWTKKENARGFASQEETIMNMLIYQDAAYLV